MHEASLLNDLMKKITDVAAANSAVRVTRVSVWLGALTNISAGHFREHFVEAARGSIADGAKLETILDDNVRDPRAQDILLHDIEVDVEA